MCAARERRQPPRNVGKREGNGRWGKRRLSVSHTHSSSSRDARRKQQQHTMFHLPLDFPFLLFPFLSFVQPASCFPRKALQVSTKQHQQHAKQTTACERESHKRVEGREWVVFGAQRTELFSRKGVGKKAKTLKVLARGERTQRRAKAAKNDKTAKISDSDDGPFSTTIIAAAAGGFVLLVIIAVGVVIFIRKRGSGSSGSSSNKYDASNGDELMVI